MTNVQRIIYTNMFANSIHYPIIDYIFNINEFYKKGDYLIVCFWDFQIYDFTDSGFVENDFGTKRIQDITLEISKLLTSLNIKHKIIYLSDGIKRISNNDFINNLLHKCYTNIKIGDIEDMYEKHKYLKFRASTLSKINFMVMDYLICIFFKELYPNLSNGIKPSIYHTGERFFAVKNYIEETISKNELIVDFPKSEIWKALPILNYITGNWMSTSMSKSEIKKIISENYDKDKSSIKDLIKIAFRLDRKYLNHKIEMLFESIDKDVNKQSIIDETSDILHEYFNIIKNMLASASSENSVKKINYVNNKDQFSKMFEVINSAKVEILKFCNGKNNIEDIIKKVNMKESSTRSYISRMKKENLISSEKKPKRLIDEIVINFE